MTEQTFAPLAIRPTGSAELARSEDPSSRVQEVSVAAAAVVVVFLPSARANHYNYIARRVCLTWAHTHRRSPAALLCANLNNYFDRFERVSG